jgi:hypothetical protein
MAAATPDTDHELSRSCIVDAPPEKVFQAWTDPALLQRWFASRPGITSMVLTLEDHGGRSKYTARVRGESSDQLEALVAEL